jgi:hypothetical protein
MPDEDLDLIPDQATNAQEFFETPEAYAEFCRTFLENVQPDLEKQREARQQSEAEAKLRWMR